MAFRTLISAVILSAAVAAPAMADEQHRRRPREDAHQPRQDDRTSTQARERAVPRTVEPRRGDEARRDDQARRESQARHEEQARRTEQARRESGHRRNDHDGWYDNNRRYDNGRNDHRRYDTGRYAPRIVRPAIIRVAPYRPYVYRPTYGGGYYGSEGIYPYGPTPRGYFDPIPGRYYGGVRITGAPRDAQVFADGYYVGIVNDFDGIFQHINLDAGRHHLEIDWGGYEPIAFDVYVRPGDTTTFRADGYFRP